MGRADAVVVAVDEGADEVLGAEAGDAGEAGRRPLRPDIHHDLAEVLPQTKLLPESWITEGARAWSLRGDVG